MPDDSPKVAPIGFSADNEHIFINTAEARLKDKNKIKPTHVHDHS